MPKQLILRSFTNKETGLKADVQMMRINRHVHYVVDIFDLCEKRYLDVIHIEKIKETAIHFARMAVQ